jgi:hypothetical protein
MLEKNKENKKEKKTGVFFVRRGDERDVTEGKAR